MAEKLAEAYNRTYQKTEPIEIIAPANHKKACIPMSQSQPYISICSQRHGHGNARERVTIRTDLGFTSD